MPKNTKGGNKARRGKKDGPKREIVLKSANDAAAEAYACVIAALGANMMSLRLEDMTTTKGIVRGALRKKAWINAGDVVRVQLREGEDVVDIVSKYTADESKELVKMGEVPQALLAGPSQGNSSDSRAGATAIRFVQSNTAEDASRAAQVQAAQGTDRKKNVEGLGFDLKNLNRGIFAGRDDDDDDDDEPVSKYSRNNNRRQNDSSDEEDEEMEEGEEAEEGEEGEEEEEEEEEDPEAAALAARYYDESRGNAQDDWNAHHRHQKDSAYKQRNKRAGQAAKAAAGGGVKAEDVEDI